MHEYHRQDRKDKILWKMNEFMSVLFSLGVVHKTHTEEMYLCSTIYITIGGTLPIFSACMNGRDCISVDRYSCLLASCAPGFMWLLTLASVISVVSDCKISGSFIFRSDCRLSKVNMWMRWQSAFLKNIRVFVCAYTLLEEMLSWRNV